MKTDKKEKPLSERCSQIINVLVELFSRAKMESPEMIKDLKAIERFLIKAEPKEKRTGRCKEHNQPGGCQLHNLHCGYPECDEYKS